MPAFSSFRPGHSGLPPGEPLEVRLLFHTDSRAIASLLLPVLQRTPYCREMGDAEILAQCFEPEPPTVHESHWIRHQVLGAFRRGRLVGFADLGMGYDPGTLHRMGDTPVGLLRFLALPDDHVLAAQVAQVLLAEAETFWRMEGIQEVRAFSFGTGYPAFQFGAGILPAAWEDHLRQLHRAGYRLHTRYTCLRRPLRAPLREPLPRPVGELWIQDASPERRYQIFSPESARIAMARLALGRVFLPAEANPVAYLHDLTVVEHQRGQGLGRWLLRRMVNDATLLGCREMVVHVAHDNQIAWRMLVHHGFEELPYRGYSLVKTLPPGP